MKKLICRPYLSLVFILSALFFPVEAWAELYFMYAAGGPQVTEKSVNWSERGSNFLSWPIAVYNGQMVTVTYSSGDANVATVSANGDVTIVSPGEVSIKASYTSADDGQTYNASYTLTIVDDRDDMTTAGAAFSLSTASATYGDATVNAPTISTGKLGNETFTYSSSNESVSTVDNSGNVTIKGAGTAEIKASFAGNATFKPGYLTYTLTVAQKEVGLTWGTTEFTYDGSAQAPTATATGLVGSDACDVTVDGAQTNAGSNYIATASALSNANYKLPADNTTTTFSISKAASSVTTAPTANTLTYSGSAQALVTAGAASGGTMQYSLDNQTFAESVPTGIKVGSYTVYYKVVGDANHENAEGGQVVATIAKANATVTFASKTASGKMGEAFTAPKVTTTPADLTLAYTSSNTKVATVDSSTGALTLVSAGETTITATFAGNDNYNSASDSYTLVIEASDPTPEERLKLEPIVKEVDYTMDESDFINADGSEVDLSNTIVNNILFTLKNQESSEGDGYDTDEHCIVINTVTLTSTVNTLIANGVEPGSSDYASQFTGMTFIVPAGEGYIIVTSQEAESIYLMVKVGNDAPVAINMPEMGDYSIPYKSNAKTYVYLWNGGTNANGTRGKKSMVDMRVRRVAYKSAASDIQQVIGELPGDERWYNLNGLRITRPTKKGVYIHGNRKVVIK